jgi:hypothetical protein
MSKEVKEQYFLPRSLWNSSFCQRIPEKFWGSHLDPCLEFPEGVDIDCFGLPNKESLVEKRLLMEVEQGTNIKVVERHLGIEIQADEDEDEDEGDFEENDESQDINDDPQDNEDGEVEEDIENILQADDVDENEDEEDEDYRENDDDSEDDENGSDDNDDDEVGINVDGHLENFE